jgi:glycosyltransferase involved in cell wall biosynthesis
VTLDRIDVMVVVDALAMGGAEQVAVDHANTFDRRTHRVHVLATRDGGPLVDRLADDVSLTILGRSATWDLRGLARFARIVRRSGIDVIHSHGRGAMKFVALARGLGLITPRHVFHDHFGWLHLDRGAGVALRAAMRLGVDAYLGVDARLCSWACTTAGMPPERTFLCRSGVDASRFARAQPLPLRSELAIRDDQLVIAMIANLRHPKDHPTLLRALAEIAPELRDRVKVVIVGALGVDPAYEAGCRAMIERLGLADQVVLYGPSADPPALLAAADAAVLSSKNETGPLVVLEYMAAGLPFIATDTGELSHAVRDLGVGFVPPPRDHLALAAALTELISMSDDERRAMGDRGRQVVLDTFDQPIVTRQIEEVYELVLGLRDRTDGLRSQRDGGSRIIARPAVR